MLLRLYWVLGSLALAWMTRDSQALSMMFLVQARIVMGSSLRSRCH